MVESRRDRAIHALLDALTEQPDRLPIAELLDVHRSGHDVAVRSAHDRVVAVVTPRRHPVAADLSPREQQVAALLAEGRTNRQIGAALGIRLGTVKDHVHAVLTKSDCQSRTEFAARWHRGPAGPLTN